MKANTKITAIATGALAAAAITGLCTGTAHAMTPSAGLSSHVDHASVAGIHAGTVFDTTGKHDCKGKNDCKGQGGCKSDDNGCKGKNDCKGKGGCNTNKS